MNQYSVTIDLSDAATLPFLQGKSLRVYKSVGSGATGLPVVWFQLDKFAQTVTFTWTEQYGAYVQDGGTPTPGVKVLDSSSQSLNLNDMLTASDNGVATVSHAGVKGAVTVHNSGQRDWMCGMGQVINGKLSPICAFDLGGNGESIVMMPYEKVLLVFESTGQIDTGTVVATALSASCSIELDGANTSRSVVFTKAAGWTGNTQGWVTLNDSNLNLAQTLIVPSSQSALASA